MICSIMLLPAFNPFSSLASISRQTMLDSTCVTNETHKHAQMYKCPHVCSLHPDINNQIKVQSKHLVLTRTRKGIRKTPGPA